MPHLGFHTPLLSVHSTVSSHLECLVMILVKRFFLFHVFSLLTFLLIFVFGILCTMQQLLEFLYLLVAFRFFLNIRSHASGLASISDSLSSLVISNSQAFIRIIYFQDFYFGKFSWSLTPCQIFHSLPKLFSLALNSLYLS